MAARNKISDAQFNSIALEMNLDGVKQLMKLAAGGKADDIGTSRHANGPHAGEKVKDAYMVGGASDPSGVRVPTGRYPLPTSGADLGEYRDDNAAAMAMPNVAFGAWGPAPVRGEDYNPKTGLWLDASNIYPKTSAGKREAMQAGVERNEEEVGELDSAGDYVTGHNPRDFVAPIFSGDSDEREIVGRFTSGTPHGIPESGRFKEPGFR